MDAFLAALVTFGTQVSALATWMQTTATQVFNNATEASNSATAALGATDYQGEYNAATLYAVGESVTKIGSTSLFVKKTTAAAGTAPVSGTDWLEVPPAFISDDLASQVQAEAGTDNATLMTPLRAKQAIDQFRYLDHLETISVGTAVAAVEIVIPSGYHSIEIYFSNLRSSGTSASVLLRTSSDGGSSFISTTTYHTGTAGTRFLTDKLNATTTYNAGSMTGKLSFSFLEAGFRTMFGVDLFTEDNSTASASGTFITMRSVADLTDAVQIYLSAGNIESGAKFEVYGIKAGS